MKPRKLTKAQIEYLAYLRSREVRLELEYDEKKRRVIKKYNPSRLIAVRVKN